jgi:hypothetical protein
MTNATKSLAVIFVVLLVLTAAVKWSSGPAASDAFRSNLVEVDTAQVNKMVIENPVNPTLTFQRNDQQWTVSGNTQENYPADASGVTRAINRLNDLKVNAVATRNPEKFTRYKVDSTGIKISLYDDNDLLNSILIGAPQRAGQRSMNTYVRLADEDAVYTVEVFLQSTFSRELNDWRDKVVWDVDQSNISRVDFLYPADSSFTIEKVDTQNWVSDGDSLSYTEVNSVLSRLDRVNASDFADSVSTDAFGTEKYALQIELSGGERRRLRLKDTPADSTVYLGAHPDFPYVFTLQKNTWDDYALKSRDELLRTSNK